MRVFCSVRRAPGWVFLVCVVMLALCGLLVHRNQLHHLRILQLTRHLEYCGVERNNLRQELKGRKQPLRAGSGRNVYTGNIRRIRKRETARKGLKCEFCVVYDFTSLVSYPYGCVPLDVATKVCVVHPDGIEGRIDNVRSVLDWSTLVLHDFRTILQKDESLALVDVGSGIGVFSLTAARMGRKVLAVEPNPANVVRFHKALDIQPELQDNITLLVNEVGDNRGPTGIVYLDDLTPFCVFHSAVLRIDTTSDVHKVFTHAQTLFASVNISVVVMKWSKMAAMYAADPTGPDVRLVDRMIDFLLARHYTPLEGARYILHAQRWDQWPDDVIWIHADFHM